MAETYFLIVVNEDGTLTSYAELPETLPERARVATNWDVYANSKQIAEEFDRQLLVDRITQSVINAMTPVTATTAQKVKDALKERGIDPESIKPAE